MSKKMFLSLIGAVVLMAVYLSWPTPETATAQTAEDTSTTMTTPPESQVTDATHATAPMTTLGASSSGLGK